MSKEAMLLELWDKWKIENGWELRVQGQYCNIHTYEVKSFTDLYEQFKNR